MNPAEFNHVSTQVSQADQESTASQVLNLTPINEQLRIALEQLQWTQEELRQKNQMLEIFYQRIEQEREQLRAAYQKICEQTALLNITTDLTNKKQLETQLHRDQRLENLGILTSGIAHDLKNVLAPILMISQLLRLNQPNLDARSMEMLKIIEDSAQRGAAMIKQIMTFTRGKGGKRSPVQIAPLLQEVIETIQPTLPKSIAIDQNIPNQSLGLVAADSTHLHQVFMNLCVNARDAMPKGGVLTLSVENCFVDQAFVERNLNAQIGKYVVVTVTDTGIGIPPEIRDRIFEPFFTTKPPSQGTGLGLATVLRIVNTYGGFLQVFSEVGEGTSVKVYLPMIDFQG